MWSHNMRGRIYTQLFQNGCPENREQFRARARRSLDIALALENENDICNLESIAIGYVRIGAFGDAAAIRARVAGMMGQDEWHPVCN